MPVRRTPPPSDGAIPVQPPRWPIDPANSFDERRTFELILLRSDDLRAAESRRLDDLIDAERMRVNERLELEAAHSAKVDTLRAEHAASAIVAEAKRIDAIRAVDVAAVAVANERATQQAAVLANQVIQSAETLRALVATTAATAAQATAATAATTAQQLSNLTAQFTERVAALEKSQYTGAGSKGGAKDLWAYVWAIGMGLTTVGLLVYNIVTK